MKRSSVSIHTEDLSKKIHACPAIEDNMDLEIFLNLYRCHHGHEHTESIGILTFFVFLDEMNHKMRLNRFASQICRRSHVSFRNLYL